MWTNDRFTFKGKYDSVNEATCLPKPIQKPSPKILIGGKGEKLLLRAVARYADAWNIDELTTEDYAHKLQVIKEHCSSVGTDYDKIEKTLEMYVLISDKPEQQQRLVDWTNGHIANSPERKRLGKQPFSVKLEDIRKGVHLRLGRGSDRTLRGVYQYRSPEVHDLFYGLSYLEQHSSVCKGSSSFTELDIQHIDQKEIRSRKAVPTILQVVLQSAEDTAFHVNQVGS